MMSVAAERPVGRPYAAARRTLRMRKRLSTIILILIFLVGLSLLLYPTVSDYWNSMRQSHAITSYTEDVANLNDDVYEQLWTDAQSYNRTLIGGNGPHELSDEERKEYEAQLNVSKSGIIGYIEIQKIDCSLPIYRGTDEAVLQIAVGHIEGSSLPVGGESTHCVLSGHRGLPSAKLFTNLDKLVEGDTFVLNVLDETLTYEVDQILIVLPHEVEALQIEEGKDYCTLVTCTPYGINSHRLLVRGHRVGNAADTAQTRVTADAVQIDPLLVAPLAAIPMLLMLLIYLFASTRKRKSRR